jgi:hypothetical protein
MRAGGKGCLLDGAGPWNGGVHGGSRPAASCRAATLAACMIMPVSSEVGGGEGLRVCWQSGGQRCAPTVCNDCGNPFVHHSIGVKGSLALSGLLEWTIVIDGLIATSAALHFAPG